MHNDASPKLNKSEHYFTGNGHANQDVDDGGKQLHFAFWERTQFGLLTEPELAGVLGVSTLTLSRWRRNGDGPAFVQPGKTVFYHREAVAEWLKRISKDPQVEVRKYRGSHTHTCASLTGSRCDVCFEPLS